MARPYRLQAKDCLYHITSRGNDRKKIYTGDSDYKKFLEYLLKAKDKYKFYLYAYVLMPNHYHLLIETTQANLSRIMQYLNTAYTVYYNVKYRRCGHLFQGRYKSIIVEKDSYLLELTRYIHLNPFRAKMAQHFKNYKWSSCCEFINKQRGGFIDKERINEYLNMSSKQYLEFLIKGIDKKEDIFKNVYAGFILGKAEFIEDTLRNLKDQTGSREFSHRRVISSSIEKEEIINAVAKKYRKKPEELYSTKRSLRAKKIAIYLLKRLTGLTNKVIGEEFGVTYSAVSKTASDIERLSKQDCGVREEISELISHFKV